MTHANDRSTGIADRIRPLNDAAPVIDAALETGNAADLPVPVYHGRREDDPHASDRLYRFIPGAGRDPQRGCAARDGVRIDVPGGLPQEVP